MRDIGERPAMDERRRTLGRLDEIGLNGLGEQRHHRSGRVEIFRKDRLARARCADDDTTEAYAKIFPACRERHDGHDLRSCRDKKTCVPIRSVTLATGGDDDVAQSPVVHIERTRPRDGVRIEIQIIAMEEMRVD